MFGYGQMSRRSLNKGCACPPRNQNVAEGVLVGRNSSWIYNDSALDADRNSRKFELLRDSELGLARRHCRGHLKRHQVVITACVFIVFWATHRKNRICRAASCCNLAMILRSKKPWSLGDLAPKNEVVSFTVDAFLPATLSSSAMQHAACLPQSSRSGTDSAHLHH